MLPVEFKNKNFWSLGPREEYGDKEASTIHQAVGEALSQWELLETQLAELFSVLVKSDTIGASRVYGNLMSSAARIQSLDCAAEIFFETGAEGKEEYQKLIKYVSMAGGRRNEIAHGIVLDYASLETPGGGYFLTAPTYNTRKNEPFVDLQSGGTDPFSWTTQTYVYTSAQITSFTAKVRRVEREALNLSRALTSASHK